MSKNPLEGLFTSPERERIRDEPIVKFLRRETVKNTATGEEETKERSCVGICGIELPVYQGREGSRFTDEEFADFSLDEASLDLLKRYAIAAKLNQPILIEGETDIGKTKTLEYLAHLTNHHLYRLSLSGQTDVSEFIGKYVPNTEDARCAFERILRNRDALSPASKELIKNADKEFRGLTEKECRLLARQEGIKIGKQASWVWQDGMGVRAMTEDNGAGAWWYLDEIGGAEPQILLKLNRLFETKGRLELAENGNRTVEAGPEFRLFASTNPPEYAGNTPFRPDFLRRWVYQKIDPLSPDAIADRLRFIFRGEIWSDIITDFLGEFFMQVKKAKKEKKIGKDQQQEFQYEFSDLIRVRDFLREFDNNNLLVTLEEAVDFYFTGKLGNKKDRDVIKKIFQTVIAVKKTKEKLRKLLTRDTDGTDTETADERVARETAEELLLRLKKLEKKEPSDSSLNLDHLALSLSTSLTSRFSSLGSSETFSISSPEIPQDLTQEHLDAIEELFPSAFKPRILPTLEELKDLDSSFTDIMYPPTQREEDTAKGLTSFRQDWWNKKAELTGFTFSGTWGEAYFHSMREELKTLGGSLILLDTAIKPNFTNGSQHYGSKEGSDSSLDPLLPLFQEVFGEKTNRFNHSHTEITTQLIPKLKEKITEFFTEKGLFHIDFDVILVPAILDNMEMTLHTPASSSTTTWEWTSTPLIDDENNPTGFFLVVGYSEFGGASFVDDIGASFVREIRGARLAVVFRKK